MSELDSGQELVPEVHLESADVVAQMHLDSDGTLASPEAADAEADSPGAASGALET